MTSSHCLNNLIGVCLNDVGETTKWESKTIPFLISIVVAIEEIVQLSLHLAMIAIVFEIKGEDVVTSLHH
jgi:hypothetical protein